MKVFLLFFSTCTFITQASSQTCYDQQGVEDSSLIACSGSSSGGCCRPGDICYSNGLCKGGSDLSNYNLYYDGCTTPDWSSPGCVSQCLKKVPGANGLQPCGTGSGGVSSFCCLGLNATCDCSDSSLLITVPVGVAVTSLLSTAPSSTGSSMASSSQTSTATTTSPLTSTAAATNTLGPTAVPEQTLEKTSGLSTGTIVAIVVGSVLGVLAIAIAAWIPIRRRRSHQPRRLEYKRESMSGLRRLHEIDGAPGTPSQSRVELRAERCSYHEKDAVEHKSAELP